MNRVSVSRKSKCWVLSPILLILFIGCVVGIVVICVTKHITVISAFIAVGVSALIHGILVGFLVKKRVDMIVDLDEKVMVIEEYSSLLCAVCCGEKTVKSYSLADVEGLSQDSHSSCGKHGGLVVRFMNGRVERINALFSQGERDNLCSVTNGWIRSNSLRSLYSSPITPLQTYAYPCYSNNAPKPNVTPHPSDSFPPSSSSTAPVLFPPSHPLPPPFPSECVVALCSHSSSSFSSGVSVEVLPPPFPFPAQSLGGGE